jgi:hypothetical protein
MGFFDKSGFDALHWAETFDYDAIGRTARSGRNARHVCNWRIPSGVSNSATSARVRRLHVDQVRGAEPTGEQ